MSLFIELLQVSLGTREGLSRVPSVVEWEKLFLKAEEQAIVGILLCGLERLPAEQMPPLDLKLQWIGDVQITESTNKEHRKIIAKIYHCLERGGVKVAFMKGLTCAARYPNPERRECGDIDFVVDPEDFVRTLVLLEDIGEVDRELIHEHHGMVYVDDVILEPHYKVHNFQNPKVDKAMREMFAEVFPHRLESADILGEKIPVFPAAFECALLVGHMVNHVYAEGLGLRQVIDFYYWLKAYVERLKTDDEIWSGLRRMKMERAFRVFVRICEEYFGLSHSMVNLVYTEKEKKFANILFEDILRVGNFGRAERNVGNVRWLVPIRSYLWVVKRCCELGWLCPAESWWWPVSKANRFVWKKRKGVLA